MNDDGLGFFASTDAALLGWLYLTDDPAPDCECGDGEAADDPLAPATVRWACGCDGPQNLRRARQSQVKIGSDALFENLP